MFPGRFQESWGHLQLQIFLALGYLKVLILFPYFERLEVHLYVRSQVNDGDHLAPLKYQR